MELKRFLTAPFLGISLSKFFDCVFMLQLVDVAAFNVFMVILTLFYDPHRNSIEETPLEMIEIVTKLR